MASLYIISAGKSGPIKVGISDNPHFRLANLQIGNPRKLFLVWHKALDSRSKARGAEKEAHIFLSDFRQHGEWFKIDPGSAIPMIEACLP